MRLIDCNNLSVEPYRFYGGMTGPKIGVWYEDSLYMLKAAQRIRPGEYRNVEIPYAYDSISEYIGSHIYEICRIPVHETLLGEYRGRTCVLCRDDSYPERVIEFREWRNQIMDDENIQQDHSGMSPKISDIMEIVSRVRSFNEYSVKQRFWDMFVVDALIGNTDRNNGNWGFKVLSNSTLNIYPVYDCGGCLNNKKSDRQLEELISSGEIKNMAYNCTSILQNDSGCRINPLHYIKDNMNPFIAVALNKLPGDMSVIRNLIDSVKPIISDIRAEYYKSIIELRLEYLNKCSKGVDKFTDAVSKK